MLTNEIVLAVFADYLNRDADFEVILTNRGYTVMGWDKYRMDWTTAEKAKIKAECDVLTEQCEQEAGICSS